MSLSLFSHYFFGYVGTAVCSIGLILTLCSVYIFTRRHMRSTVSTYLASLSISDSCLLLMGLIVAINDSIHPSQQSETYYSSRIHKRLFPYVYPCIIWFQFTSVWITVGFAIDRWFAIKWPMLHYTYSSKRASYIVIAIYCFGFIYSMPRFFEYRTKSHNAQYTSNENSTAYIDYLVMENRFLHNHVYHYIVRLVLYSIFQSILPLLMLSYFNIELIRSVNASSNFLKHFTTLYIQSSHIERETNMSRHREGAITRSVICLIGLFILCQVPASILNYLYMFYRSHPILYISYEISNFLIIVNSAVNFFVFTYFNRRFRRELTRICFRIRKSRNSSFQTPSRLSYPRTNSSMRNLPINSQLVDVTLAHSWESQSRNHRLLRRLTNGNNDENAIQARKKSLDSSLQSTCHHQSVARCSESLTNLHLNNTRAKREGIFPIKNPIYRRSKKNFSFPNDQVNLSITSKYNRRYSERLSFSRKNTCLTIHADTPKHRGRPLHYVTYKHEQNKQITTLVQSPTKNSTQQQPQ